MIEGTKDIQFINAICLQQLPNNFTILYFLMQINLCKDIMKMCSQHIMSHIYFQGDGH
jgi:hypothetical protein